MIPKNLLTIYGRNPVLEALQNKELQIYALHLSKSNKKSDKIDLLLKLAKNRDIEVKYHDRDKLSRISKNKKQDQGVALDIILQNFADLNSLKNKSNYKVLALDGIENPQNLGMIIRSAAAGNIEAIILAKKGNASLVSPLVIKASAGTLFKMPIIEVDSLQKSLKELKKLQALVVALDSNAKKELKDLKNCSKTVFVLGNESKGVSKEILKIVQERVKIAMKRDVESLNVAVTASIIAFCS